MKNKLVFWISITTFIVGLVYLLSSIIAPFITGAILAYLLESIVSNTSNKLKISRDTSTLGVLLLFSSLLLAFFIVFLPIVYEQLIMFVSVIPRYQNILEQQTHVWFDSIMDFNPEIGTRVNEFITKSINDIFRLFSNIIHNLWGYTIATINIFSTLVLVPFIVYYFLKDWSKITSSVESLYPKGGKDKVREIISSIDILLSNYIKGQLNVCIILSIYYTIVLKLVGFDFALLIGLISGFFIIIPFIGAFIAFLLVMVICYASFGYGVEMLYLAVMFGISHLIEGYILTPKIIGNKIGLHPLWILFSMFVGGNIFGITGIMFAIPVGGICKILIEHLVKYYKSSIIYHS